MMASLSTLGLVVVVAGVLAYAVMPYVIQRFTYRTWIFDCVVVLGHCSRQLAGSATVSGHRA